MSVLNQINGVVAMSLWRSLSRCNGVFAFGLWLVLSPVAATDLRVEVLAEDLKYPWSLAQLPNGDLLLTTKPGELWRLDSQGRKRRAVEGVPEVAWVGQGGLLDVVVHPQFAEGKNWIYLSYSASCSRGFTTTVSRHRLHGHALSDGELLFEAQPCSGLTHHFAGRLVLDAHGHLFITVGDRGERSGSQRLDFHHGKVIRLLTDGSLPPDNPFLGGDGTLPEIWSYGHRNPQGLALHPQTGALWLHEHGPRGGDELNRVLRGANYGWPIVTYGEEYIGGRVSELQEAPGIESPRWQWTPSIAPSGFAIYDGAIFPAWKGHFLVGALKFQQLHRLAPDADGDLHEHILPKPRGSRIRDVRVLADEHIYVLTDSRQGQLLRLSPQN